MNKAKDPNVGGGVDRKKVPAEDFAGKNRSFPIVKPGDVSDAAASIGRAGSDNYSSDELKSRITSIAKRKGPSFVAQLPKAWTEKKDIEIGEKCGDDWDSMQMLAMPYAPYNGATSLDDVQAIQDAQEQAEDMDEALDAYNAVIQNIMASPDISDKGAAIAGEATKLQKWFNDIVTGVKSAFKAGARHNAQDNESVQTIHDASVSLGAMCAENKSAFVVTKDANNNLRWLAVVSNSYRDNDNPPQVITDAAHKEFVAYLDANPASMPELWHWHTPHTRWGVADMVDYADNFVIASGTVDKGHEAEASKLPADIAVSHGFIIPPGGHDKSNEHITKYRTFEISPLPASVAANKWTNFATVNKEATMPLTGKKKDYLVSVLGEARVADLEKDLANNKQALDALGIESKDQSPIDMDAFAKAIGDRLDAAIKPLAEAIASQKQAANADNTESAKLQKELQDAQTLASKAASDLAVIQARVKALEGDAPLGNNRSLPGALPQQAKKEGALPGASPSDDKFVAALMGRINGMGQG